MIPQFPHCDSRILHAPGECKYCDCHPDWQELRTVWNIAFTGQPPRSGLTPCPAEQARSRELMERWPGNQRSR